MRPSSAVLSVVLATCAASEALPGERFNLTYHVERTPSASLGLDRCADVVEGEAARARVPASVRKDPGQLGVVSGGADGIGSFIVQCIAVDDKTVTVVQGIDYRASKAQFGRFADAVQAALKAASR